MHHYKRGPFKATKIIGKVSITNGTFFKNPIKGEFDLTNVYKNFKNKPGGFITIAVPRKDDIVKCRVNVPGEGQGYIVLQ